MPAGSLLLTTSGNFHTPTLDNVIAEMGIDRVMFSVDYPYENMAEGAQWFDNCPLEEAARWKVARSKAQQLLKLAGDLRPATTAASVLVRFLNAADIAAALSVHRSAMHLEAQRDTTLRV